MTRKTISIDGEIEVMLRELQSNFIRSDSKSWSLSRIVNLVLLSGLVGSNELSVDNWQLIKSYLDGKKMHLQDREIGNYVSHLMPLKQLA